MAEEWQPNWSGQCPRCGGPLSPNVGGGPYGAMFAASPPQEVCESCLTGAQAASDSSAEGSRWRRFGAWLTRIR
jgi:hypothetical protein